MKTLALVFCCLLVSSYAVNVKLQPTVAKKHPKLVLAEIAAKLKEGGPLEDVFDMLQVMKGELVNEQADHDQLYGRQSQECQTEQQFRNTQIGDATDIYNRASQHRASCDASNKKASADLQVNLNSQDANRQRTELIILTRQQQHEEFLVRVQAHKDGLVAVDEAFDIVDEFWQEGSGEFVQIATLTTKMFQHSVKMRATHHYAPVIAAFAQFATNQDLFTNENSIRRLQELLEKLRQDIQSSLQQIEEEETQAAEVHNQLLANQEAELHELVKNEAKLRELIGEMETCITIEGSILTQAGARRERNTQLLEQFSALCNTFSDEYNNASAARKQEIQMANEIMRLINVRLGRVEEEEFYAEGYGTQAGGSAFNYANKNRREFLADFGSDRESRE